MNNIFNNQKGSGLIASLILVILVLGVFIMRDSIIGLLNPSTPSQSLTFNPSSEINEEEDEEEDDDAIDVEEFPDE